MRKSIFLMFSDRKGVWAPGDDYCYHFRERETETACDWSEVDSVEAGYVCYDCGWVKQKISWCQDEGRFLAWEPNISVTSSGPRDIRNCEYQHSIRDQYHLFPFSFFPKWKNLLANLLILSTLFWNGIFRNFFNFFFNLSGTISGYEESQELPLKFEDIVDKYYDKMRPPRTGGKLSSDLEIEASYYKRRKNV